MCTAAASHHAITGVTFLRCVTSHVWSNVWCVTWQWLTSHSSCAASCAGESGRTCSCSHLQTQGLWRVARSSSLTVLIAQCWQCLALWLRSDAAETTGDRYFENTNCCKIYNNLISNQSLKSHLQSNRRLKFILIKTKFHSIAIHAQCYHHSA